MSEIERQQIVPWDSEAYQDALAATQESYAIGSNSTAIYGAQELSYLDYIRAEDPLSDRAEEQLKSIQEELLETLDNVEFGDLRDHMSERLTEDLVLSGITVGSKNPREIIETLDGATFESLLRVHIDNEIRREIIFQEEAERFKEHFMQVVMHALEAGRLSANADPEAIANRIRHMQFVGIDPLMGVDQGRYESRAHRVHLVRATWSWADGEPVSESGEQVSLFHSACHEGFHGIGGKTVVEQDGEYTVERSGIGKEGELHWLNEAGAEEALMLTFNISQSPVRIEHRALLNTVLVKGRRPVPKEIFMDAYLEDHPLDGVSAWDVFCNMIADAYSPDFLEELNAFTAEQEHNIHEVINCLQNCDDPGDAARLIRELRTS